MNLLTIVLASGLACQVQDNKEVIGLWESMSISRGGIGHNFELRSDGSYTTAVVVLVDLAYEIKDGKLYVSKNKDEPVSYEKGAKVVLNEETLVLVGDNGEKEIRNRLAKNSSKSIVDKYKYRHYTGSIAYEQFTKDGKMKFRLPMESINGCYTVTNDSLIVSQPGDVDKKVKYRIYEGKLQLKEQKNVYSYNPVKEGAWYVSDKIDYIKPAKEEK